jgi:NADPH:quinone reductase-like Zn-dependent oxidoreductase
MPTNTAAWMPAKKARFQVGPAPYTPPADDEIVVANRAVAVNPVDWITQDLGYLIFSYIHYPWVLGSDLAGEVVEVGSAVTRFAVGDRVLGHAVGFDKHRNRAAEGAFQDHTVVLERMASPIPDSLTYEQACVVPLALSTAACGLFQADQLGLAHPSSVPVPTGKTVVIWGGSTSVGSNAVQLAVAAGYDVVTTASPANAAYVTKLGAGDVVDYRSPTAVDDVVAALKGRTIAGAMAIGSGSAQACSDVVAASAGTRFVSMVTPPASLDNVPSGVVGLLGTFSRFGAATVSLAARNRVRRIRTGSVFGTTLVDNEVCRMVYQDFLPQALASGHFVAAPPPLVVGRGLEHLQSALDRQKDGVSAQKVVVSL